MAPLGFALVQDPVSVGRHFVGVVVDVVSFALDEFVSGHEF